MNKKTGAIVGVGVLTAVVIVLQALSIGIRFSVFSITLTLVPIIVGAAVYGCWAGAWLGTVFGIVVLLTDAQLFLAVSVPGTILVCILKGAAAGFLAGAVYMALQKKNKLLAAIMAGIVAPVVNTGIFLIGCRVFFYDTISGWASAAGFENAGLYMIVGLTGINFVVEMIINLALSAAIVQIVNIARRSINSNEAVKRENIERA